MILPNRLSIEKEPNDGGSAASSSNRATSPAAATLLNLFTAGWNAFLFFPAPLTLFVRTS